MKRKLHEIEEEDELDVQIQTYTGPNLSQAKEILKFYSNYVFSSVIQALSSRARTSTLPAIPTTVNSILKFNNVHLCNVKMYTTNRLLPEPVIGWISDSKQNAELYINEDQFYEYCARSSLGYVSWSPMIDFSQVLGPYEPKVSLSIVKCAVLCDHVAQHLLSEYYNTFVLDSDPHTGYLKEGCTFASMLKISKIIAPTEQKNTSTYGLLGDMANFNFTL
jgi:hypothetical protein